jgi:hypothetical protein
MKTLRTTILGFVATALVAMALPASAADKLFLVKAKVYTLAGSTPVFIGENIPQGSATSILLLEYENKEPNGANSVIKSIAAHVPALVKYAVAGSNSLNVNNQNPDVSCSPPPSSFFNVAPTTNGPVVYTQNNITGVKPQGSFCLYLAVTTTSTSCSAVPWKAEANTGNSITGGQPFFDFNVPGQPFSLASTTLGCTGVLGCDASSNTFGVLGSQLSEDVAYIGDPNWGLARSLRDKPPLLANCTAPVPFNFEFDSDPAGGQKAVFTIPPNSLNQLPAVHYVLLWSPVPAKKTTDLPTCANTPETCTAGWQTQPSDRPKLGWLKDGNNQYVLTPALRCVHDDISGTANPYVSPLPKIPNEWPFTNYIGAAPPLNEYAPGNDAKMCVSQTGSTSVGPSSDPLNPVLLQNWLKVIDYFDGVVSWD